MASGWNQPLAIFLSSRVDLEMLGSLWKSGPFRAAIEIETKCPLGLVFVLCSHKNDSQVLKPVTCNDVTRL